MIFISMEGNFFEILMLLFKTWWRTSLVIQWLRYQAFNARGTGSIPGRGSSSCHGMQSKKFPKVMKPGDKGTHSQGNQLRDKLLGNWGPQAVRQVWSRSQCGFHLWGQRAGASAWGGYVTSVLSLRGMAILGELPVSLQRCCLQTRRLPQRLAIVGPQGPPCWAFASKASEWDTQPGAEFYCYYSLNYINLYSNISF